MSDYVGKPNGHNTFSKTGKVGDQRQPDKNGLLGDWRAMPAAEETGWLGGGG